MVFPFPFEFVQVAAVMTYLAGRRRTIAFLALRQI
jgi:hypothetical protein